MTDYWLGFAMAMLWCASYSFLRRYGLKEVWICKYELERLYRKEENIGKTFN